MKKLISIVGNAGSICIFLAFLQCRDTVSSCYAILHKGIFHCLQVVVAEGFPLSVMNQMSLASHSAICHGYVAWSDVDIFVNWTLYICETVGKQPVVGFLHIEYSCRITMVVSLQTRVDEALRSGFAFHGSYHSVAATDGYCYICRSMQYPYWHLV